MIKPFIFTKLKINLLYKVLERYGNDGFDFLLQVFNNPDCLEEVTGLAELHNDSAAVEVWEYTDEDDED